MLRGRGLTAFAGVVAVGLILSSFAGIGRLLGTAGDC